MPVPPAADNSPGRMIQLNDYRDDREHCPKDLCQDNRSDDRSSGSYWTSSISVFVVPGEGSIHVHRICIPFYTHV